MSTGRQRRGELARGLERLARPQGAGEAFVRGQPRPLFSGRYAWSAPARGYDISADGQRFLMGVTTADSPEPLRMTSIDVILNWHEVLKRLAPAD